MYLDLPVYTWLSVTSNTLTGLVPACVQEYIEEHSLYITKEQGKIGMRGE